MAASSEQLFGNIILGSRGGAVSGRRAAAAWRRVAAHPPRPALSCPALTPGLPHLICTHMPAPPAEPGHPEDLDGRPGVEAVWRRQDGGGAR